MQPVLHVYFLRDRSFMFNSYKDPVAGKERFLKARLTQIFQTPHTSTVLISVLVTPVF